MNTEDFKDISKIFFDIRTRLNAKEKELLELQRREPNLLGPDSTQIETLIDSINSLHLSTQDGSFLFPSNTSENSESLSVKNEQSINETGTGIEAIKTLPSNVWLSDQNLNKTNENPYRLPMVTHLLSLPLKAYLSSSTKTQSIDSDNQPSHRLPMVTSLLSVPLDLFKVKKNSSEHSNNSQINQSNPEMESERINSETNIKPMKSLLDGESIYSKEFWLRKSNSLSAEKVNSENCQPLDLDKYIEKTNEKMRRLHLEYLQAMEQIKSSTNKTSDSISAIQSIYPNLFHRIQPNLPTGQIVKTTTNTNDFISN